MKFQELQNLLVQSPPPQFQILEKLLDVFARKDALKFAFVRGSIARNDYDRTSDVDLVIGIEDSLFESFIQSLDFLMEEHFNPILPGWNDKIVPDFGGLGYVYLIPENGQLFQVDLYVIPASKLAAVRAIPKAKQVYMANDDVVVADIKTQQQNQNLIQTLKKAESGKDAYLVEAMILAFLLLKRIKRGQVLLNYSETVLLNSAIRNIFRLCFEPHYINYGWYHFMEHDNYPESVLQLKRRYMQEVTARSISSKASLKSSLELCQDILDSDKELLNKFSYSFEVFEKLLAEV